jgi:RNA polymerase sigma-70 factor (ECF subfamily)
MPWQPGNLAATAASKDLSSLRPSFEADALTAPFTANPAEPAPPDAQLLLAARNRDRAAFGQVVARHQDRLFTAVLRMVGNWDEARELTQEAFTRALMKLDGFRGDAHPYTWLFRIAMNLVISRLRKDGRRRVFSLDAPRGGSGSDQASGLLDRLSSQKTQTPDEALERREARQQVLEALGRLDAEYRAILVMRDIEGFDYQQMADVLNLPLGTLKSRLFRARLALRDELKTYMKGT